MTGTSPTTGWIGIGRMGYPMVERLLKAGHKADIWNRTRSKAGRYGTSSGLLVPATPERFAYK